MLIYYPVVRWQVSKIFLSKPPSDEKTTDEYLLL